jgi:hypothetical protein
MPNEVTESAVLTVTVAGLDVSLTGTPEESVTWSSKVQAPTVDSGPVEVLGVLLVVQENELPRLLNLIAPGASWSHWQVYGGVPPLNGTAERIELWPASTVEGATLTIGSVMGGLTVSSEVDDWPVAGGVELSVTTAQ